MRQPESHPDRSEASGPRWRQIVRAHPVIVSVLLGCTFAGIGIGIAVLPDDWTLLRRVFGGAVAGAGVGLLFTAPRIIG